MVLFIIRVWAVEEAKSEKVSLSNGKLQDQTRVSRLRMALKLRTIAR